MMLLDYEVNTGCELTTCHCLHGLPMILISNDPESGTIITSGNVPQRDGVSVFPNVTQLGGGR